MDLELDLFDDKPATTNAPAGGKFKPRPKPKAKPILRKGPSLSVPSALPSAPKEKTETQASTSSDSTKPTENVIVVEGTSGVPSIVPQKPLKEQLVMPYSAGSEPSQTDQSVCAIDSRLENSDILRTSGILGSKPLEIDDRVSTGPPHLNAAASGGSGDRKSSSGKSTGQNADMYLGSKYLDDFLSQPTAPTGKSQHVVDEIKQTCNEFPPSFPLSPEDKCSTPSGDVQTLTDSGFKHADEEAYISVASPVNNPAFAPTDTYLNHPTAQDPVTCRETNLSDNDVEFQVGYGSFKTEAVEAFPSLDNLEIISESSVASGHCIGKFLPKPKVQRWEKNLVTSISDPNAVSHNSSMQDSHLIPPECENIDGSTVSAFGPDNEFDISPAGPNDPNSELPFNEEPINPVETAIHENTGAVSGVNGELSAKRKKRKSSLGADLFEEACEFSTVTEKKSGESSRQLRKLVGPCNLVNESEDNTHESGDFLAENPSGSVGNESDDDDEYRVGTTSLKKPAPRKSKKPVVQNEKTVRKRKKAADVQEEVTKVIPKKFSHSTRRKRRQVDRGLLETPEDELDRQNIPLKDLILLAEYNERLTNKEAATLKTPSTNQRSGDDFPEDALYNEHPPYNEEEDFASEQGRGSMDGEETLEVQEANGYFNYHTYMDKVPKSRWSKHDTELFYEGIRQFGADISMIQQLFRDRTRRQVLLKFKKEERQHPSRLDDALRNRTQDHSQFEKVIEQLKQAAAQEKLNTNKDDSIDIANEEEMEEEAVTPKTMVENASVHTLEEIVKPEKSEEELVKDPEVDVDGSESPMKSQDSDDDFSRWCQYKSDI